MSAPTSLLSAAIIETAGLLAESARSTALKWFRKPLDIESKTDQTPVTQADKEAEQLIRDMILQRHPDHSFFGEETGFVEGSSPWRWIIDPIDGTKSFACGKPTFGSLIALTHEDRPILGIIDMPALDERWTGIAGLPAVHNQKPCRTSGLESLDQAVVLAATPDMFQPDEWQVFNRVTSSAKFRNFGTDCYGYGLLALGHADIVMESDLKPYDYMALIPVVEGAGGVITDWQGNSLGDPDNRQVLASASPVLHDRVLELIAQ